MAETCVSFLRKNKLGTATFIVLNKQNYRYSKISTPSNVPRLLDLIKPRDERFIPAFFLATRNTLVADNLDQAMKVYYYSCYCHDDFDYYNFLNFLFPSGLECCREKVESGDPPRTID